jgi:hypothetical protein
LLIWQHAKPTQEGQHFQFDAPSLGACTEKEMYQGMIEFLLLRAWKFCAAMSSEIGYYRDIRRE